MLYTEVLKSPLTWGGGPSYEDAKFNPYWSPTQDQLPHFPGPLNPLSGPKHPIFVLPDPSTHVNI
jgi:hypothetical protein